MKRPPLMDFDDALARLLAAAKPVSPTRSVSTLDALGQVLAEDIVSPLDVPPDDVSAMDGYAVRSAETGSPLPVALRVAAGDAPSTLPERAAARIFTGAPVPCGADAVVMQEQAGVDGDRVSFTTRPEPGQWVRRAGEDVARGATVLRAGTRLGAQHLGLAASVGHADVTVRRRVRAACFFTGNELQMPGEPLRPGSIYNSNRFVIASLLAQLGCEVVDLGIVRDSLDDTRDALRRAAAQADLIVTSGGVSVGDEDHVRPAVQAEGGLDLWQIALKPGKPLAFGHVGAAHFIGLPGNPVSAFVTFAMLVRPFIRRLQGVVDVQPAAITVPAAFDWPKADSRREFLRARLDPQTGRVERFPNQSSGVLTSVVWAGGLVDVPAGTTFAAGDPVRYLPFGALFD